MMNISTGNANFECANTATGGGLGAIFPVAPFSAFHLLRNYNYLVGTRSSEFVTKQFLPHIPSPECTINLTEIDDNGCLDSSTSLMRSHVLGYNHYNVLPTDSLVISKTNMLSPPCGTLLNQHYRRPRGEKKPIPNEQKDDKYYERRKRNNQAAKKSRDARKQREDQIALRATLLEHENALLKAQLLTVREEASSLRKLLLEKKTF